MRKAVEGAEGVEGAKAWRARRPGGRGGRGGHIGWMEQKRRAVRIGFQAPKAHLGLGGDEHVLRARHERRLELGPELGLDLAAHRAAWSLCGLEALGVRDEREQKHGGAEHRDTVASGPGNSTLSKVH